jgi:hypothetical protein
MGAGSVYAQVASTDESPCPLMSFLLRASSMCIVQSHRHSREGLSFSDSGEGGNPGMVPRPMHVTQRSEATKSLLTAVGQILRSSWLQ